MVEEEMQVVVQRQNCHSEGILSIPLVPFLFDHANIVLIPAWMLFAEAATTTEGATFSSITEMIKKLT